MLRYDDAIYAVMIRFITLRCTLLRALISLSHHVFATFLHVYVIDADAISR